MKELELLRLSIECIKEEIATLEKYETARFNYLNERINELQTQIDEINNR